MPTQLGIIDAWDEMADDWDDVAAGSAKGFYRLLQKHVSLNSEMTVLDFGCGTGLVANILRHRVKHVVAVDVSPVMVELFLEKMQAQEWENVQVFHALLGDSNDEETQQILKEYEGQIDLIVASSVLGFVTPETVGTTMEVLGRLLKPGGSFCHTDPSQMEQRNHFTRQKAEIYYKKGGLETVSTSVERLDRGQGQSCNVFLGIARQPL
jgi:SAM-dependent methyltransferase